MTDAGQFCPGTSHIIVYTYFLSTFSWLPPHSVLSATASVNIEDYDKLGSDWLDQRENDLSPVQFNDVYAEKMIRFFKKLNSLRRNHQQNRLKSNRPQFFEPQRGRRPFASNPELKNDNSIVQQSLQPPPLSEVDNHKTYHKGNKLL